MFQNEENNSDFKGFSSENKLEIDLINIKNDFENKFNYLKESFVKAHDVSNFSRDTGLNMEG